MPKARKNGEIRKRMRSPADKEIRRALILSLATMLFVEGGYNAVKMRDIAQQLGTTAAALYTYFKTKDDILLCIIQKEIAEFESNMKNIIPSESFNQNIYMISLAYLKFSQKFPHMYNFLYSPDTMNTIFLAEARKPLHYIGSKLKEVLETLQISDVEYQISYQITGELWAYLHGQIIRNIHVLSNYTFDFPQLQRSLGVLLTGWQDLIQKADMPLV